MKMLEDDKLVKVKYLTPEEAGWVKHPHLPRTWYMPDGCLYVFPPGGKQEIVRLLDRDNI